MSLINVSGQKRSKSSRTEVAAPYYPTIGPLLKSLIFWMVATHLRGLTPSISSWTCASHPCSPCMLFLPQPLRKFPLMDPHHHPHFLDWPKCCTQHGILLPPHNIIYRLCPSNPPKLYRTMYLVQRWGQASTPLYENLLWPKATQNASKLEHPCHCVLGFWFGRASQRLYFVLGFHSWHLKNIALGKLPRHSCFDMGLDIKEGGLV